MFGLYFYFNKNDKIHDCVGKALRTAANQNRVTVNSHQLSSSFFKYQGGRPLFNVFWHATE